MRNPQAHHDMPRAFRAKFEAKGFDIDYPAYGRWVEGTPPGRHQNWTKEFNAMWQAFFDKFPSATRKQILDMMYSLRADPRFQ
jgi:hypothetical protein